LRRWRREQRVRSSPTADPPRGHALQADARGLAVI
jgi:hypothetical protein